MEIVLRDALISDDTIIADFNARMAEETEQRSLDRVRLLAGVRSVLSDPSKGRYSVAVSEGRVIGQLMITYEWSDWRNGYFWWIQSVYVDNAFRGQGVFKRLFARVSEIARQTEGVCGLRLYVDESNRQAIAAYEVLGMKKTTYRLYEQEFTHSERQT